MNRYKEIMGRLEVTPEMRTRILKNTEAADLTEPRILRFPGRNLKKYLSLAACFVLLLAGGLFLPKLLQSDVPQEPDMMTAWGAASYSAQAELEKAVGFTLPEISNALPFETQSVQYFAYEDGTAEVVYTGDSREACLRKSVGTEDNSGDYTEYGDVKTLAVQEKSVTVKGENGVYTLALWQQDGYFYSLRLSDGLSAKDWETLLHNIK